MLLSWHINKYELNYYYYYYYYYYYCSSSIDCIRYPRELKLILNCIFNVTFITIVLSAVRFVVSLEILIFPFSFLDSLHLFDLLGIKYSMHL